MVTNSGFTFAEGVLSRGFVKEDEVKPALVTGRTKLAWGAVVAGALTSISLLMLGGAFAYALRLPVYIGGEYGVGAAIYGILVSMLAFFIGGTMVSHFSPRYELRTGLVHGLLAWVLAVPLMLGLLGFSAGAFGGYLGMPFVHAIAAADGSMLVTAGMAWGAFLAMFLGMISAAIGGMVGYMSCDGAK